MKDSRILLPTCFHIIYLSIQYVRACMDSRIAIIMSYLGFGDSARRARGPQSYFRSEDSRFYCFI